jgi:hypothetical protein
VSAERKRAGRRLQAIRAYVGANGAGKSWCAVYDLLPSLESGRPVLSNLPLYLGSKPHPLWVPLVSWRQLVEAKNCDVLLDEVTGVASARSFASLPAQLLQVMVQLRKRNVTLSWTSPNFARADVVLREITRCVVVCQGTLPKREAGSEWASNRLFRVISYDAIEWEDVSLQKREKARPLSSSILWRPRHPVVQATYDTKESVSVLDHVDMAGSCLNCGRKKKVKPCDCPDVDSALALALGETVAGSEGDASECERVVAAGEVERCAASEAGGDDARQEEAVLLELLGSGR